MTVIRTNTNWWNGKITLRSASLKDLDDTIDRYETIGYSPIVQKDGSCIYRPFFHQFSFAIQMIKSESQLEKM